MSITGWVLLVAGILGGSSSPMSADCLKPVLTSIFPPELRMGSDQEVRSITLFGENFGFDPVWQNPAESSRCRSQVWVRRKGFDDEAWLAVGGVPREESGEWVLGEGSQDWVRIDLRGSTWSSQPGEVEFMVVRGTIRTDGSLQETGRSQVRVIAVVPTVHYELSIETVHPPAVRPGSPGAVVTLEGRFTWDTEVWMEGRALPGVRIHPGLGKAEVRLNPDQLKEPDSMAFRLHNRAGAVSNEVAFFVADPTLITKAGPKALRAARNRQNVKLRFEGAEPERVEIRFQPPAGIAPMAVAPQREDFSEGFSKRTQVRSESVEAGPIVTVWRAVDFEVRRGEVRLSIDSEWVPGAGSLLIRLSGRTGDQVAVIPVEASESTSLVTPAPPGGPPEMDHKFTERPKY